MTITVAMICLNEEECLPRALKNLGSFCDELIIVDTGSDDATTMIAQKHGAQVLHYDWVHPGNKGAARNVGLDAATSEWICVLDADEIIQDPGGLRKFITEYGEQYDCLNVRFQNYAEDGTVSLDWYQPRIFRRGLFEYRHREHELPWPVDEAQNRQAIVNTILEHRPPPERAAPKVGPMLERLELDVQEHPGDLHPLYFLARQYVTAQMWDKGIEANERYIREAKEHLPARMMTPDAYQHLSMAQEGAGNIDAAFESQFAAIAYEPHRRAFWVRLASMTRHFLGDHALALAYMHVALSVGPKGRESSASEDARLLAMLNHSLNQLHGGQ